MRTGRWYNVSVSLRDHLRTTRVRAAGALPVSTKEDGVRCMLTYDWVTPDERPVQVVLAMIARRARRREADRGRRARRAEERRQEQISRRILHPEPGEL